MFLNLPSMRYLIIITFFILSCSKPSKYSLTGNVDLNDDEKVFLVQMKDNRPVLIDSTSVAVSYTHLTLPTI